MEASSEEQEAEDEEISVRLEAPLLDADVTEEPVKAGSSSRLRTWVNVTKCFVGAASFELPWACSKGGLAGSVIGLVGLAALSGFALKRLARCAHLSKQQQVTYPRLAEEAFGRFGFYVGWFGVFAMSLGVCGSYFVFVSQTAAELLDLPVEVTLLATLLIVGTLSWIRELRTIAFTSAFGVAALVVALFVVSLYAAEEHEYKVPEMWPSDAGQYGLFLGNAGFLYLISTAILPLALDVERPTDFAPALDSSLVAVTVVNLLFALFCWLRIGSKNLKGNVVDNLPASEWSTVLVKVLLMIDLIFTAVVYLFPLNQALEAELTRGHSEAHRKVRRFCLVIAVALVAYACPSFELLTGLTGGFGNNILGFVIPPPLYLVLATKSGIVVSTREKIALFFVFCFGIFFLLFSTLSFVTAILHS